ncbi:MAG: phosphatidate cytidylyltransferase [Acidiferrobacteraceae bacterium]
MTAVVLIALMFVSLFALPPAGFVAVISVITLLASLEWAGLNGFHMQGKIAYAMAVAAAAALSLLVPVLPLLWFSAALWLCLLGELLRSRGGRLDRGLFTTSWSRMAIGIAILVPAWRAVTLIVLSPGGRLRTVLLLAVVSCSDIAAYVVGRPLGRTKIAPHVSPGKSAEGLAGAAVGAMLLGFVTGHGLLYFSGARLGLWVLTAASLAVFSLIGDLTESRMKRIAGVKDSGWILPGHGGVFDRIDGFTAAAPVYALASLWLSRP